MSGMRVLLSCAVVVFACAVLAAGQTGSIQGTVTDTTGAVVSGANIAAVNSATGASRSATSSESGVFSIPALAVGEYTVTVEKTGFAPVKFNNIDVTVALTLPLNARLTLGTVAETVDVSGSPSAPIETETSQVSNLVDSEKIKALPLITRNPYELV